MSLQDMLLDVGDALAPYIGALERNPLLRWALIGVLWLALMFRLFGRGTSGQRHGLLNWYDWVVIAFGAALLWTLQFG